MTRFALWGGGRRHVQIGSTEDRRICAQRNRAAAFRLTASRIAAAMRPLGDGFAALGVGFRKMAEAMGMVAP